MGSCSSATDARQIRQRQPALDIAQLAVEQPQVRPRADQRRQAVDRLGNGDIFFHDRQRLVDLAPLPMHKADHEVAQRLGVEVVAFHAQPVRFLGMDDGLLVVARDQIDPVQPHERLGEHGQVVQLLPQITRFAERFAGAIATDRSRRRHRRCRAA